MYQPPSPLAVTAEIGKVTFFEVTRDKILYNIIVFSFLLLALGYLASKLTLVRPDRVILDFGLAAVAISCSAVGIIVGSSVIGREFDRRTIYVALSHPISRFNFLLGKFAGIVMVLAANWILLTGAYLLILWFASETVDSTYYSTLAWGLVLALFQSVLTASIAILFSTFSTTSLSAVLTVGFYLIGTNISQIRMVAAKSEDPGSAAVLNLVALVLPNLEWFSLGTKVTYGLAVTWQYGATAMLYGIIYTSICLTLAGMFIRSKEA